jgi:hypothetical protein
MNPDNSQNPPDATKEFIERAVFSAEIAEIYDRRAKVYGEQHFGEEWNVVLKALKLERELEKLRDATADWGLDYFARRNNIAKAQSDCETKLKTAQAEGPLASTKWGLVGLALSGGGIRSATFSLGVLQGLAERGLLKHVDYMSTVSGGGYIGSCLSSLLNPRGESANPNLGLLEPENFPFRLLFGAEPRPVTYLRQNAKFLSGKGINLAVAPALVLRGIILNLAVILPIVLGAAILTSMELGAGFLTPMRAILGAFPLTKLIAIAYLLMCLGFPIASSSARQALKTRKERRNLDWAYASALLLIFGGLALELLPYIIEFHHRHSATYWKTTLTGASAALGVVSAILSAGPLSNFLEKWSGKILLVLAGVLGPGILFLIYLQLSSVLITHPDWVRWYVVAGLLLILFTRPLDANSTSLHNFYRDRLSKTFLFSHQQKPDSRIQPNDMLKLTELKNPIMPYHIINATLNLSDRDSRNLNGRKADFFFFSRRYCGSARTGYIRTHLMEERDNHLDLGTAMAISGAAAAPNMGPTTIKPLVFLMGMLNIRMGYWLINPHAIKTGDILAKIWKRVGPLYLVREMLGRVTGKEAFVNLSDGGHLENLGVYELLRRRCKYVIAVDAEADPNMEFPSLAAVMRYARIDMGIEIRIDLSDVRRDEKGFSAAHCAMGTIDYGKDGIGYLLYIKSSVTGDEIEYVRQYNTTQAEFPHESTADQFFDEDQLEAYRSLGHHAFGTLFSKSNQSFAGVEAWFEELHSSVRPSYNRTTAFTGLQGDLISVQERFADPAIASYTYEIFPELKAQAPVPEKPVDREAERKIFNLCDAQIQLMENTYIALQLDQLGNRDESMNRGWMNLFRRWAQSPRFRLAWAITISTYSEGFQRFCKDALSLSYTLTWRRGEHREAIEIDPQCRMPAEGHDTWVAEIEVKVTADETRRFPAGAVLIETDITYAPCIAHYAVLPYLKKMRLLEDMMETLPSALRVAPGQMFVRLPTRNNRIVEFFEKRRFNIL